MKKKYGRYFVRLVSLLCLLAATGIFMIYANSLHGKVAASNIAPEQTAEEASPAPSEPEETTVATTSDTTPSETTEDPDATPTPEPEYVEPEMKEAWYNGFSDPRTVRAEVVHPTGDVTVLVNKYYTLTEDYEPDDLVNPKHAGEQKLRKEAADSYEKMYDACKAEVGNGIYLISGYRSFSLQKTLFTRSMNKRSLAFACKRNAYQGRSEHQLGLAMDISPEGSTMISDDFGKTKVGQWVDAHCHEYGFIRRFQTQWINETGYDNEAWHYRYVGVELATYLTEHDMSLEAYYDKCQVMP
ncbi:MAG: M15 family metallopeptidase [Clostridiales bacterium]|nr:M15 family metallopeptidase [Clostridiales bacterium]